MVNTLNKFNCTECMSWENTPWCIFEKLRNWKPRKEIEYVKKSLIYFSHHSDRDQKEENVMFRVTLKLRKRGHNCRSLF